MIGINHRVNNILELKKLKTKKPKVKKKTSIIVADPTYSPTRILTQDFLKEFNIHFIILNIKSEGIEEEVLRLVKKYNVPDYFFLDTSIPFMVKYIEKGWTKFAVRFSEYEPVELALKFKGKIEWVWVDCFNHLPLTNESYLQLKKHFKICLVSPELQGHPKSMIEGLKNRLKVLELMQCVLNIQTYGKNNLS